MTGKTCEIRRDGMDQMMAWTGQWHTLIKSSMSRNIQSGSDQVQSVNISKVTIDTKGQL